MSSNKSLIGRSCFKKSPSEEIEAHVNVIVHSRVSDQILAKMLQNQQDDTTCQKLKDLIITGWDNKKKLEENLKPSLQHQDNLSINERLIMFGPRVYRRN